MLLQYFKDNTTIHAFAFKDNKTVHAVAMFQRQHDHACAILVRFLREVVSIKYTSHNEQHRT